MPVPQVPDNANARQLGTALEEAAGELATIRAIPRDQRTDEHNTELRNLRQFVIEVDAEHQARSAAERASYVPDSNGPQFGHERSDEGNRSIGEFLISNEDYLTFAQRSGAIDGGSRTIAVPGGFQRALLAEGDATGSNINIAVAQPYRVPTLTRRLFIRNLLSQGTTGIDHVPYMQETNIAVNELLAGVTAEGQQKNEVALAFSPADAPVRKITAWIPLTSEIVADAPTLRAYVDNRLLWMLKLAEERQILNGSGTAPQLRGIRQTSGLQTQAAILDDVPATIALAIGKVENVDGEASAVAMNPLDYWQSIATRHTAQFDNAGGGNAPSIVANLTWGLPVVRTRNLERNKSLVADWEQLATIFDREDAYIEVGNQHLDYFTTNKIAVKAEERLALAVERPYFAVEATLAFTPA